MLPDVIRCTQVTTFNLDTILNESFQHSSTTNRYAKEILQIHRLFHSTLEGIQININYSLNLLSKSTKYFLTNVPFESGISFGQTRLSQNKAS